MGRRIAFIITLTIMGFSTASIGLLPTFKSAGWFAPISLIVIRMLQGRADRGTRATFIIAKRLCTERARSLAVRAPISIK